MLQVVVGEEAGVDVFAKEFSKFQDELILKHLEFDISSIKVLNGNINKLLFLLFMCG